MKPEKNGGHVETNKKRLNIFSLRTLLTSLQHLIFEVANAVAFPVVVGSVLGLGHSGTAALTERTFLLVGIASLVQALWGHRYPIIEGPAGIWTTVVIVLASLAVQTGKSLPVLRTDIETGVMAAGVLSIFLGAFRLMPYIRRVFTPLVNGTFLIVLALQFSAIIAKGLLSTSNKGAVSIPADRLVVFLVTIAICLFLSLLAKGFIQSIAILIGTTAGWILAYVSGAAPPFLTSFHTGPSFLVLPKIFAWGTPTFNLGITLSCLITGIVVLANLVASVSGMSDLQGKRDSDALYDRTVASTGISDILAALGSTVGFVPYASSLGFISLTGVLELTPFIIGNSLLLILALIPSIGSFLASMPITIGYAILFSVAVLVLGSGIKESVRDGLEKKDMAILGVSIMVGNGITFLPTQVFAAVPSTLAYLVANGLIVSVVLCIFLQHVVFREYKRGSPDPSKEM